MKKIVQTLFLILCCFAFILSCEKTDLGETDTKIAVTGISISQTSLTLTEGETSNLTATIAPSDATNKNYSWSSSNSSVAVVEKGSVTAVKEGSATITVKTEDGGKTASCQVIVKPKVISVSEVSLDKNSIELTEGDQITLIAIVSPENATNKNAFWSSSDDNVASVDNTGKATAKKEGSATITVKTEDGGKTATCIISVKKRGGVNQGGNEDIGFVNW